MGDCGAPEGLITDQTPRRLDHKAFMQTLRVEFQEILVSDSIFAHKGLMKVRKTEYRF